MKIDNAKLFERFPLIGPEFNHICIDLLLVDVEEELYTAAIQYLMVEDDTVIAGFTMQTGIAAIGFDNIIEEVGALFRTGFFDLQDILNIGHVFHPDQKLPIKQFDWELELDRLYEENVEYDHSAHTLH